MTELEIVTAILIWGQTRPPVEIATGIVQLGIIVAAPIIWVKAIRALRKGAARRCPKGESQ
jgi:hypothetical protein